MKHSLMLAGVVSLLVILGSSRATAQLSIQGLSDPPASAKTSPAAPTSTASVPSAPSVPPAAVKSTGGLVLDDGWDARVTVAREGHTAGVQDMAFLLTPYGTPEKDLQPHPEMEVYPGLKYLAPLADAEKLFFRTSRPTRSVSKLAIPGFPEGLFLASYDVQFGIYNRMYLVIDRAQQVAGVEFVTESGVYVPPSPPFQLIEYNWRIFDFVNARAKAQSTIVIDGRVSDQRSLGYLIVNMTGTRAARWARDIPAPGIVAKPAPSDVKPKQTATWYVPKPIINLILFCVRPDSGK